MHYDLMSNIFLCRYVSRTLRMKLLTWCKVISLAGLFGLCSGLNLSKYFRPAYKTFYYIKGSLTTFSFRDVDLLWSPR